jgi:hypothetical protein
MTKITAIARNETAGKLARWVAVLACVLLGQAVCAHASVALLMEEPYGEFGAYNPTGHAAVYLNHICAESPTQLRVCRPGERGVVISRYHKIDGYDWIAIPLIPYLYAVDGVDEVPMSVDKSQMAALRDAYRRKHLELLAPDTPGGGVPKGEWTQLVGASYDRKIHGFEVISSAEQDAQFIALYNDKRNIGHFNLLFHNCADFSRVVLDTYMPHAVHRNFVADVGLMTPKQVARSLVAYGKKHPELEMSAFVIPQVSGTVARSHGVDGVAGSLVRSKRYLLPLAVLAPEFTGGVVVAYLAEGTLRLPKNAMVFNIDDPEQDTERPQPVQAGTFAGDRTPGAAAPSVKSVDAAPMTPASATPVEAAPATPVEATPAAPAESAPAPAANTVVSPTFR